jgi:glycerol-3-phosphate dehydrogenase
LPVDPEYPQFKLADLQHAARHEHVKTLIDLLFRRTDLGWTHAMGLKAARLAAEAVADILGWDAGRVDREVEHYERFVRENFNPAHAREQVAQ